MQVLRKKVECFFLFISILFLIIESLGRHITITFSVHPLIYTSNSGLQSRGAGLARQAEGFSSDYNGPNADL